MRRLVLSRVHGMCVGLVCALIVFVGCSSQASQTQPLGKAAELATRTTTITAAFDPSVGAPLPAYRIVAAYGIVGGIDVNGPASTIDMLDAFLPKLQQYGQQYAALDPTHPVKLGIDLVVNTLQLCRYYPKYCASWTDDATIQAYVDFCQKHDLLLFFDVQLGVEPVDNAVTTHLEPYLQKYPFTELALDTEFHFPNTPDGYASAAGYPCCLGWMNASEINWTINHLSQMELQYHMPRKVLIVHEWNTGVLPDKDKIQINANVSLVLQSDGFGSPTDKLFDYRVFVQRENLQYGGYKVFLPHSGVPGLDSPVQAPSEVMDIFPQPLFISYQ